MSVTGTVVENKIKYVEDPMNYSSINESTT